MGMFSTVKYETSCRSCKTLLTEFQTKDTFDADADANHEAIENFYTQCSVCFTWNEFKRVQAPVKILVRPAVFEHDEYREEMMDNYAKAAKKG